MHTSRFIARGPMDEKRNLSTERMVCGAVNISVYIISNEAAIEKCCNGNLVFLEMMLLIEPGLKCTID